MTDRFLLSSIALLLATTISAQEPMVLEPEAPETIFDQKLGDVGVLLEADGTWTTRFVLGTGLGFSPSGPLPALGYPGFEKGAVFSQRPDFSLTLRLLERYYLQMVYGGTLDDRTFLLGYQGKPDEGLQWVKLGNASFGVPARAGETLADGRKGAPAAGFSFHAGPTQWETAARYEDGSRESRTFRGFRESNQGEIPLSQWISGRFFRLPAVATPFSGIRVLVVDPTGPWGTSPERYRDANSDEVIIDTSSGEIRLASTATKKYLVSWAGASGWAPSPTPLLGLTPTKMTDPALGSGPWYVLFQPGVPSPFEVRNHYPVALGTSGAITLVHRDEGTQVPGFSVAQGVSQDWFEVSGPEEAPFWYTAPGLYPAQVAPAVQATLPWVFRLPTSSATTFALGPDVSPTSLIVVRNGVAASDFRFDATSGNLTLGTPVFETDKIEISYQKNKTGNKAADLVWWQGGRWDFTDSQNLEWAVQGRWNMEQGRYTSEDLQAPGRLSATLAYSGQAEAWSWKVAATGGGLLADSTGRRRLYGFAQSGAQASLDGNALRPSAVPSSLNLGLTESNRGSVLYRNYWSNDPLTGAPSVSAWGKSGIPAEPVVAGGWMGPYLVRGDGVRTDRLAVLESVLDVGQWAGMQVYLDQGRARDLRATSAISLTIRVPDGSTGDRVFLQAGTLSDDWDGTGTIRKVEYLAVPALAFQDQTRGPMYFPMPDGSTWGNDADGDGSPGTDGSLITWEITGELKGISDWQTIRRLLTDGERQRLQRTTGWRLVVVRNGAVKVTRTMLLGPVVFEGSTWGVGADSSADPASSISVVEKTDPTDSTRQLLQVDWNLRPTWRVEGRNSTFRPASYKTLRFRYKLAEALPAETTTLRLTWSDGRGRGLTLEWPVETQDSWQEGTVNLLSKEFRVNGNPIGGVTWVPGGELWDRLIVEKGGSSSAGQLLMTEVEAVDSQWEALGSSNVRVGWKQPEPWPSREWPLIQGVGVEAASIQSGLTSETVLWTGRTTLSGSFGPLNAQGEAILTRSASNQEAHGAYTATLPLGWQEGPRVELTDQFSDQGFRSEKALVQIPWIGTLTSEASVKGPPVSLDQTFRLDWKAPVAELWGAGLGAQWVQSYPRTIALTGFVPVWQDSWSWLVPPNEIAPYSLVQLLSTAKGGSGPFSFTWKNQNQALQSGSPRKWTAFGNWELQTPWKSGPDSRWSLIPSVSKEVETVFGGLEAKTPTDSAVQGGLRLWTSPTALGSLPFMEWISGQSPWREDEAGFQSGRLRSTASLTWEGSPSSEWTDLVVPVFALGKVSTLKGREGTGTYESSTWTGQVQHRALNVFGSLGSAPLFPWYRTDVWTSSLSVTWGQGTRESDRFTEASNSWKSEFVIQEGESLSLPATYQGRWASKWSQSVKTSPSWTLKKPLTLPFDLPRWLSPVHFRKQWIQEISTVADFRWQTEAAPPLRDLLVSWKGRFVFDEKSELDLTARWGQQWQQNLTVVGLEAAVDLILSF